MTRLTSSWDIPDVAAPVSDFGKTYRPFEHEGMYDFFKAARREEPVFYCPEIGYWVVTRRKDILPIFRDPDRFSASIALSPVTPFPDAMVRYLQENGFGAEQTQVNCDRPKHTRVRQVAAQFLNMKVYHSYEPQIRALVTDYVEELKGRNRVDIVDAMTYELPARVLFLLMGIPDSEARKIKEWADNRLLMTFGKLSEAELLEAGKGLLDFWRYCQRMIEDRQTAPKADYASKLLEVRDGDDSVLTLNEAASLVFGVLLAGHETTTNGLNNVLLELLRHRDQWERLVAEPDLIANAVEEGLRFSSSVIAWRRRALEDVEIGGVAIPKGSNILVALGSANHDESQFKDPEVFDVARKNAREHIAFGNGIHFCIGAPLARLEIRIVLETLTKTFPNMRLVPQQRLDWVETIAFRGPVRLMVDLEG